MELRNLVSRKNNFVQLGEKIKESNQEIDCDNKKLKKLITKWVQDYGLEYENFGDFLELIGITNPIKLITFDMTKNEFKCIITHGTENCILVIFGEVLEEPEVIIIQEEETRRYYVSYNNENGKNMPKVTLSSRKINKEGKKLKNFYHSRFACQRLLKIDSIHSLRIEISELDRNEEDSETMVLRNCENIEQYLFELDKSLNVDEVYNKMMEFLEFSEEDISKCKQIMISYTEKINKEEEVRAKILLSEGKMLEYALLEDGETFHVFKNGDWKYLSDDGIRIMFNKENGQHSFSVTGDEDNISNTNPSEIMKRVKTKISELREFFE